jgi:hypothetical protein
MSKRERQDEEEVSPPEQEARDAALLAACAKGSLEEVEAALRIPTKALRP